MKTKKFMPCQDYIVVAKPDKTEGGIVMPDTARRDRGELLVVRCGPGRITDTGVLVEMRIKPGDIVGLWPGSQAGELKDELLIRERDVAFMVTEVEEPLIARPEQEMATVLS